MLILELRRLCMKHLKGLYLKYTRHFYCKAKLFEFQDHCVVTNYTSDLHPRNFAVTAAHIYNNPKNKKALWVACVSLCHVYESVSLLLCVFACLLVAFWRKIVEIVSTDRFGLTAQAIMRDCIRALLDFVLLHHQTLLLQHCGGGCWTLC